MQRLRAWWLNTAFYRVMFRGIPWWGYAGYIMFLGVIFAVLGIIAEGVYFLGKQALDISWSRMYTSASEWYIDGYQHGFFITGSTICVTLIVIGVLYIPLVGLPFVWIRNRRRNRVAHRIVQHRINRNNLDAINREIDADRRRNLRRA